MQTISEKKVNSNGTLDEVVQKDSKLKTWLVDYVGINSEEYISYDQENNEVTVQMIVDVVAKEFPEFLLAVAEENWIRGYHQALEDVDEGRRAEQNELDEPN